PERHILGVVALVVRRHALPLRRPDDEEYAPTVGLFEPLEHLPLALGERCDEGAEAFAPRKRSCFTEAIRRPVEGVAVGANDVAIEVATARDGEVDRALRVAVVT